MCRYVFLAGTLGLAAGAPAEAAAQSLAEAVKAADGKYLDTPVAGMADSSPKLVSGGGEEGSVAQDREISLGPLRVTLTYVEETPEYGTNDPSGDPSADQGSADEDGAETAIDDIPPEAILPGEVGIGEEVWRAPVVTVYFDDPNAPPPDDETETTEGGDEAAATPTPAGPRVVAKLQGDSVSFADPPVSVQIAELDPGNPYPEVVVSFFTGGAHCCSVTSVVTGNSDGSAWQTVDVGEFDGGPMLAIDLDRDGTFEFETRDNAFLYAFACYACSEAPLQVLAMQDGAIKDVSTDPRFKPAHAAWLKNMIVGVPEEDVNGFLAGYVGEKIRLGEGRQAWDIMLKYYDRTSDWGLEVCEHEVDETGECQGEPTMLIFPEALERMLNENGYSIDG